MLALILGVLWFVVIFIILVQKLCLFLFHAIAEDTHRTDVDVLEECFLLDCYLVYEVFQHPTVEKITLLLPCCLFLLHPPALVVPGRWHMAVYLCPSGLSFPISFSIVPNPLDGLSAFLSESTSSVLAVGSLQLGQSRTGVLLAGYSMEVSLLPCGAKDAWWFRGLKTINQISLLFSVPWVFPLPSAVLCGHVPGEASTEDN